ncbi:MULTISPECIES: hypothetical protein [Moraxella]|uniref:Uncharacterized protein n=1 Tax=Moraxella lacunata TaxID=477 RepID=A0A1B8PVH2_MORLA|nr:MULTISPECIES: hypothetical protein [Moraxella]MBE9579872.1 hypothetical protein [Moraxella sp. K1664]MBE9589200.1 hypothetical protein [Moraxella sp. K1630]MBE9590091.1 hypothetical protein [Moraxella sp. K127]MBE9597453.1 hypothetical protein [Moraxella sp. K2450]MDH9219906.1 hypothetical protein [Moraxella lacunata]
MTKLTKFFSAPWLNRNEGVRMAVTGFWVLIFISFSKIIYSYLPLNQNNWVLVWLMIFVLGFGINFLVNAYFSKRDYSDEQLKWFNKIGYGLLLVFTLLSFGVIYYS